VTKLPMKLMLMSREATAEQCGVHVRTIDKLIKSGRIETVRLGRRVMIKIASVERLVGEGSP
jgi:excisionase family DNA binding protein